MKKFATQRASRQRVHRAGHRCRRADQGRRDRLGHGTRRIARHSREEHDRAVPEDRRRQDDRVHPARRCHRHDDCGAEHEEADRREQGRRDHRLDDDAELAGDDRRLRRRRDAGDLARVVDPHHRADGREEGMVVQDAADRRDDGRRDSRARDGQRREDDRLHRLQRRAGRSVLRRDRQGRAGAQASRWSPTSASRPRTRASPGRC